MSYSKSETTMMYGGKTLQRLFDADNNVWFKGRDVAKILGYKQTGQAVRKNVSEAHKRPLKDLNIPKARNLRGIHKSTQFISISGLTALLQKHKTVSSEKVIREIINDFHLNITVGKRRKEQEYIGKIMEHFPNEDVELQFPVGKYRIDLYFKEYRIAIECDENGHNDRDQTKELERQMFIEKELKCTFVRFNPDEENFDIDNVINRIQAIIQQFRDCMR